MPIPLPADYDAEMVKAAAKRSKDRPQARPAFGAGGDLRWRDTHRGGEDWRRDASDRSRLGGQIQRRWPPESAR
jgi:hypothetical protein